MSSDISRQRFKSQNDFNSVLMQQGRVQLDADWNEWNEILDRHWRSETIDIIGRCVVPRETPDGIPDGFAIAIKGTGLTIGRGRIYVDGLQAENHGAGDLEFDPTLAESRGVDPIPYDQQPYFPNAPDAPTTGGPHLVYIDVWEREVTYVENPKLVENAVGVDTTSRLQTVWQVRVLPNVGDDVTCSTQNVPGWLDIIQRSGGRLTTEAIGIPTTSDPCLIPPSGGYRGLENRTYRVEIHDGGVVGTATFKWSRDNASFASRVNVIENDLILTVDRVMWDSIQRFSKGDWVEITDDWLEFSGQAGDMRQIDSVDEPSHTITLKSALTGGRFWVDGQNLTDPGRHTRIKRWDQAHIVKDSAGNNYVNLDAPGGTGLIMVPDAGTSLILEDGVQVTFTTEPVERYSPGKFRSGDYWVFVARTADASVEKLYAAPPRGVHHHYGRLALVTFPSNVADCRNFWPPSLASQGECCDCTLCVSADQHNRGLFTIQMAVNQLLSLNTAGTLGGTICLGPGIFNLTETVQLSGALGVRIRGQGAATIIAQPIHDAAFFIKDSIWCTLDYMTILTTAEETASSSGSLKVALDPSETESAMASPAIRLSNSIGTTIERVAIRATGNNVALAGILIDAGHLLLTNIRDNSISAQFGILGVGDDKDPLFLSNFRCERNYLICLDTGIQLSGANQKSSVGSVFHDNIVIADNFVSGSLSGIVATGSAGTGPTHIIANAILLREDKGVSGDGIVVGIVESTQSGSLASGQIRIRDNGILKGNNGIRLVKQPFPLGPIILSGNRLEGLSENGIWIESAALLSSALIENNFLNMIGGNGILMDVKSVARSLKVLGNELTNIAASTARSKDTAEVAAINLSTVFEVAVSDNLIQDVGTNSPYAKTITGVRVIQCENIQISGNTIANIAPSSRFYELAAGIHVKSGAHNVEINGNLIRRQVDTETTTDNSQWQAVRVAGGSIEESKTAAMQAGIHGNSFYGYGNIPMVEVSVSGACQFSDNYCSLLGGSAGIEVDLTGASIIASANRVECSSEIIPLNLKTVNAKTTNPFAVVANIANGQIQVNGNPLDAPWNHLNVII